MTTRQAEDTYERHVATLERLLAERGVGRYATFSEVGEGTFFPDGTEDASGFVVDQRGRVFFYRSIARAEYCPCRGAIVRRRPEDAHAHKHAYLGHLGHLGPAVITFGAQPSADDQFGGLAPVSQP